MLFASFLVLLNFPGFLKFVRNVGDQHVLGIYNINRLPSKGKLVGADDIVTTVFILTVDPSESLYELYSSRIVSK
jgi:hypothetical protein